MHLCQFCGTVIAYPPRTTPVRCPYCNETMVPVLRTTKVNGVASNPGEVNPIGVVYIIEGI